MIWSVHNQSIIRAKVIYKGPLHITCYEKGKRFIIRARIDYRYNEWRAIRHLLSVGTGQFGPVFLVQAHFRIFIEFWNMVAGVGFWKHTCQFSHYTSLSHISFPTYSREWAHWLLSFCCLHKSHSAYSSHEDNRYFCFFQVSFEVFPWKKPRRRIYGKWISGKENKLWKNTNTHSTTRVKFVWGGLKTSVFPVLMDSQVGQVRTYKPVSWNWKLRLWKYSSGLGDVNKLRYDSTLSAWTFCNAWPASINKNNPDFSLSFVVAQLMITAPRIIKLEYRENLSSVEVQRKLKKTHFYCSPSWNTIHFKMIKSWAIWEFIYFYFSNCCFLLSYPVKVCFSRVVNRLCRENIFYRIASNTPALVAKGIDVIENDLIRWHQTN